MSTGAAIYCRISSDPTGRALGVDRQRVDAEKLVARRGWSVLDLYVDNDVSAYSGKPRPEYRRLLDDVRRGLVTAVVAWHPDRLHRSPVELEEYIALVEAHGVATETVQAGQWDLSTPSGRLTARSLGNIARYESEHKSERVRRAMEQNAEHGRRHGAVPYGWARAYDPESGEAADVVDPAAADVVVMIAKRLTAGDSIRSITADLNARGVPTPRGRGEWRKGMVRALVVRERNAGLRVHHGEVVGRGDWPPIVDEGLHEQVKAVLADPSRRTSTSSRAVHLLSGLARCGVCGGPMRAGLTRQTESYRCADRSCVSRRREDVDGYVTEVVLGRLAQLDPSMFAPPEQRDDVRAAAAEVDELRARLDNAADQYAAGTIDGRQLERITANIRPRLEHAEARTRVVDSAPVLAGVAGQPSLVAVRDVWAGLSLARRRAILDLLLTVRVERTTTGARTFDPSTVSIEWRRL